MNQISSMEKPKSKMLYYGPKALSNRELLSLVIGSSGTDKDAVDVAGDIMAYTETLSGLGVAEVRELTEVYGVGDSKACSIAAAMELGKRASADSAHRDLTRIYDARQVAEMLMPEFANEKQEHFLLFCLNAKNRIESRVTISIGSLCSTQVHPREVFGPAIKRGAASIIVAHNHPSGEPTPSQPDIDLTKRLVEASKILGIKIHDHVIIGNGCFTSMKAEGYM